MSIELHRIPVDRLRAAVAELVATAIGALPAGVSSSAFFRSATESHATEICVPPGATGSASALNAPAVPFRSLPST